ncbi:MAG: haloacid dehalogenase type II [Aeromicrobium sp.]|nr:haloacid dehalogenase type II [Aeromicrobium sp.]
MSERWVTFDCYGTMIDWRVGMEAALDAVAPGRADDLIAAYHEFEPQVEAETPYRVYREIQREALTRAAHRLDITLDADAGGVLGESLPTWPAFPDSIAALDGLRSAGFRLGILTNADVDMIQGTLAGPLPVEFDTVITAEEVRSYKPGPGQFDAFISRHAPGRADWIHVGNSVWHDCEPAHERGFRSVYVHRRNESRDGGCATAVVPDLASLQAALESLT